SYKGSGLAMMAEIFAGILTGSSFVNFDKEKGWGIFFLVFSPNLLMSISEFKKNALQLVKRINNSPSINGIPLRVPGAKSLAEFNNHKQSGVVDVNMKVLEKLQSFMNKKYEN
ncbi:MAG: Ldh family oxidoreductase, partial [bacterium]|nr:Ldh family oxidoreductase [bacterium]